MGSVHNHCLSWNFIFTAAGKVKNFFNSVAQKAGRAWNSVFHKNQEESPEEEPLNLNRRSLRSLSKSHRGSSDPESSHPSAGLNQEKKEDQGDPRLSLRKTKEGSSGSDTDQTEDELDDSVSRDTIILTSAASNGRASSSIARRETDNSALDASNWHTHEESHSPKLPDLKQMAQDLTISRLGIPGDHSLARPALDLKDSDEGSEDSRSTAEDTRSTVVVTHTPLDESMTESQDLRDKAQGVHAYFLDKPHIRGLTETQDLRDQAQDLSLSFLGKPGQTLASGLDFDFDPPEQEDEKIARKTEHLALFILDNPDKGAYLRVRNEVLRERVKLEEEELKAQVEERIRQQVTEEIQKKSKKLSAEKLQEKVEKKVGKEAKKEENNLRIRNEILAEHGSVDEEAVELEVEERINKLAHKAIKVLLKQKSEMHEQDPIEEFKRVNKRCLTRLFGERKVFVHKTQEGKVKFHAIGEALGTGAYNEAFLSVKILKGKFEVYRKLKNNFQRGKDARFIQLALREELKVHKEVQEVVDGIVKLTDTVNVPGHVGCFLEYCNRGDLFGKNGEVTDGMSEGQKKKILKDIFTIIAAMHQADYTHADLKRENILLISEGVDETSGEESYSARVADLGFAFHSDDGPKGGGTPVYMSPQMYLNNAHRTQADDNWALGIIAYELKYDNVPEFVERAIEAWGNGKTREFFNTHIKGILTEGIANLPDDNPYDAMIKGLLAYEPEDRTSCQQALLDILRLKTV